LWRLPRRIGCGCSELGRVLGGLCDGLCELCLRQADERRPSPVPRVRTPRPRLVQRLSRERRLLRRRGLLCLLG
jgi:hypothetical protein